MNQRITNRLIGRYVQTNFGCWEWSGKRTKKGYGILRLSGKDTLAHRASHEAFNSPIPTGLWVLHSCDNPCCINPQHLRVGTPKDNADDMWNRGRGVRPSGEAWRGQLNPKAKLSADQLEKLKHRLLAGERTDKLSQEFGITGARVCQIRRSLGLGPTKIGRPKGAKDLKPRKKRLREV